MRRVMTLCVLMIHFCLRGFAQPPYPDLGLYQVESAGKTSFRYHCSDLENVSNGCDYEAKKMMTEVPTWIIPGQWHSYIMVDGKNSYICSSPADLVSNSSIDIRKNGVGPYDISHNYLSHSPLGCLGDGGDNWSRDYYAVYCAESFQHPDQGKVSLGFLHGENKDVCSGKEDCNNTINKSAGNVCPFNGDYWPRYNAFVCASWIPNNASTNWGQQYFKNDLGPITWPSTGYLQPNGVKATTGVSHPSSIQYGGYVYVFYHDNGPYGGLNPRDEDGRREGIKVVRSPLEDALNPSAWKAYYRDSTGGDTWVPSLPEGFTKETMMKYLAVDGPRATDLMGDEGNNQWQDLRFSVARVRGSELFIGVESYIDIQDDRKYKTAIRWSMDLLHWTDRARIIDQAAGFSSSTMNYPIFLSADGWSNTEVDIDDFYILGTASKIANTVYKKHIYLESTALQLQSFGMTAPSFTSARDGSVDVRSVYPNPGPGAFQVKYALNGYTQIQINVLDITGKRLQSGTPSTRSPGLYTDQIDLGSRAPGTYLLEMIANGDRHISKVVKR